VAVEVVVEVVVEVAELVSIPVNQLPGTVHGRIGFGSRYRASVRQGKTGGKIREGSIGRSGQQLGLGAIVDHATQAELLISERRHDQAEWMLTLGDDLILPKQKSVAAGVRSWTLPAEVIRTGGQRQVPRCGAALCPDDRNTTMIKKAKSKVCPLYLWR
jgi:hypothetical protein